MTNGRPAGLRLQPAMIQVLKVRIWPCVGLRLVNFTETLSESVTNGDLYSRRGDYVQNIGAIYPEEASPRGHLMARGQRPRLHRHAFIHLCPLQHNQHYKHPDTKNAKILHHFGRVRV